MYAAYPATAAAPGSRADSAPIATAVAAIIPAIPFTSPYRRRRAQHRRHLHHLSPREDPADLRHPKPQLRKVHVAERIERPGRQMPHRERRQEFEYELTPRIDPAP